MTCKCSVINRWNASVVEGHQHLHSTYRLTETGTIVMQVTCVYHRDTICMGSAVFCENNN